MRPPRVAILVFFCATSLFLFCRSLQTLGRSSPQTQSSHSALRALLAGSFSLFPPNAAISLTEDNSTSFPGRPAAFGPSLPNKGISGILWIGTGFAEDIKDGETSEGELGCSDVPDWEERPNLAKIASEKSVVNSKSSNGGSARKDKKKATDKMEQDRPLVDRDSASSSEKADKSHDKDKSVDDGTDDYLHEDIYHSGNGKASHKTHAGTSSGTSHADIQSIQEAAEISGKIVLLSRGGCGFLEKVRWAQRRGAIALIVGDNVRGAPLIQMFARGNVDNVTIPSIFTSRTTAHLLSSLVQAGSFTRDILDESGHPVLKVQQADKSRKTQKFARGLNKGAGGPKGGSITPGSGEYVGSEKGSSSDDRSSSAADGGAGGSGSSQGGLISKLFGDDDGADFEVPPRPDSLHRTSSSSNTGDGSTDGNEEQGALHTDGLWVTITPSRGAIPFFDTLVLVLISPMITLALVYALLIMRSIVRRRRWRAPKSVVARLPVRTYHTMMDSDDDTPTPPPARRGPSPTSHASPTTPLLSNTNTPSRPSPRPRSRTTTAVPDAPDLLWVRQDPNLQAALQGSAGSGTSRTSSRASQVEKTQQTIKGSQWKKFRGRQLECVICLDEYVDGVSKVMSLPCGHEFHVDCM
ncbi:hypothetical protein GE09DRAFT_1129759 [Coniochaeta sp. 2T2.1]|nr:hypothetical protein GE09DRAFT_1129759 [Coniochaeta sp. 2T2.1]